jgi:predicted glycosyltransferase
LRARCRAVLVPFAEGGETEQTDRAGRLEKLGFARTLQEDLLTPESLTEAMLEAPEPPFYPLDLNGARETARLLTDRFATRRESRSPPGA